MREGTEQQVGFDPKPIEMLACPTCHGDLRLEGECLVCGGCGQHYPIIDEIPVPIAERAAVGANR